MATATGTMTGSPCAACKLQRRKCTAECFFAPYFPPGDLSSFTSVHKVFGASNVSKLLADLAPHLRHDAVHSLVYEAKARLSDPINGCVGYVSLLHHRLCQLQAELHSARCELASFLGPAALLPISNPHHPLHHAFESTIQFAALPTSNAGDASQPAQPDNLAAALSFTNNGQAEQEAAAAEHQQQYHLNASVILQPQPQNQYHLNLSVMEQQWRQFTQPPLSEPTMVGTRMEWGMGPSS